MLILHPTESTMRRFMALLLMAAVYVLKTASTEGKFHSKL